MRTFENHLDNVNGARIVSWPFRVLATFLVAFCLFAWSGAAYQGFANGKPNAILYAVLLLPIIALFVPTGGYAVLSGRVLRNPMWPFASETVTFAWIVVMVVVVEYTSH
jgi:Na+-driven multidrug efflux pump